MALQEMYFTVKPQVYPMQLQMETPIWHVLK